MGRYEEQKRQKWEVRGEMEAMEGTVELKFRNEDGKEGEMEG